MNTVFFDFVVSQPDNLIPNFFCSSLRLLEIIFRFLFENELLFPLAPTKMNFGFTPLHYKSDIEDLTIFLITKSGFLKLRK